MLSASASSTPFFPVSAHICRYLRDRLEVPDSIKYLTIKSYGGRQGSIAKAQNADDGNDNQQFDEGEAFCSLMS